jgi:DNA-binding MarR family transcriptional regulator
MGGKRAAAMDVAEDLGPVLSFMRNLWAVEHALNARSKSMHRKLGVTGPQRLVLRVLERTGPMAPGQLASILHLHPASVTRLARTLEQRQLVERSPDPSDGRKLVLNLAALGKALVRSTAGTTEESVRKVLEFSTRDEVQTALLILGRLAEALGAD